MKNKSESQSNIREYLIEHYIRQRKTFRDLCKELEISSDTLHRLLKKHDIPPRKVGKRYKK